jgi:hypothetical protein
MLNLYHFINYYVDAFFYYLLVDQQTGQVQYNQYFSSGSTIRFIINITSFLLSVFVMVTLGLFFWNQGLVAAMPNVFKSIGNTFKSSELNNQYLQLLITIVAFKFLF